MKRFKINTDSAGLTPQEVAQNFDDLHPRLDPAQAAIDAARCIYCYDAPCMNACPTRIDIPKFIHQIRSENVEGSAKTILSQNIMGGTCARACPTEVLCEEVCVVHQTEGAPVKIGELQRFAVDHLMEKDSAHPFQRAPESGKRLAVIGAGPAGLSFAHRAAMLGHDVVVYESKPKPGGLNEHGLAAYKMADDFAQREVAFLLSLGGIRIDYGISLGAELTLEKLSSDFDGVFVGVGLTQSHSLNVPGEDLEGVRNALDFIEEIRQAKDKSKIVVADNVIVIGGGNTAIDAAVQAKCLGARNVTLVYRRGPESMGATGWEKDLATANGVVMRFWSAPQRFMGASKVEKIALSETRIVDGKLAMTGAVDELPADIVLKAIGQKIDDDALGGLETMHGKISVDAQYRTSLPGVYAGGDCIGTGKDLTVQAIEDGKQAAISADAFLRAAMKGTVL